MTDKQFTATAGHVAVWTGGGSLTSFVMLGMSILIDPPRDQWWMWLLTISGVLVIVVWGIVHNTLPLYRTPRHAQPRRMEQRQMHHRAEAAADGNADRLRRRMRRGAPL